MDSELRIVQAASEGHFAAMSRIHALGWRSAYPDAVPARWMAEHITDDRWVKYFRADYETGRCHGLLLYRGETPVACINYGRARTENYNAGSGKKSIARCPKNIPENLPNLFSNYCRIGRKDYHPRYGYAGTNGFYRLSVLPAPSQQILVTDSAPSNGSGGSDGIYLRNGESANWNNRAIRISFCHLETANMLFCDGHVSPMRVNEIRMEMMEDLRAPVPPW